MAHFYVRVLDSLTGRHLGEVHEVFHVLVQLLEVVLENLEVALGTGTRVGFVGIQRHRGIVVVLGAATYDIGVFGRSC